MVRRPQDRQVAPATWTPGRLGPYEELAWRPDVLPVEQIHEVSTAEALAWTGLTIIVVIAFATLAIYLLVRFIERRRKEWSSMLEAAGIGFRAYSSTPAIAEPTPGVRNKLDVIRSIDPDFSLVLLEDFIYALYAEAQTARGLGKMDRLAPYFRPAARDHLDGLGAYPVEGIVVGAMRFVSFRPNPRLTVEVEIEANYAEQYAESKRGLYARERWVFSRSRTAHSRPPEKVRVFDCPGCGAPVERLVGGTCQFCSRVVDTGEFDWVVDSITVLERSTRGPMLTGTVEEQGTDLPTVVDPRLSQALTYLRDKDASFDVAAIQARVERIFQVMQDAWSNLTWEKARPFLSDNLFEAQSYWIAAYRAQGLRNITQRAEITAMELVRITQDRWYTAVTMRVHAQSLDFTVRDSDGQVVGGDAHKMRAYTEYWTIIRGVGCKQASSTESKCPSCGAPLETSMAARCKYCQAKVNSGDFDWVLSRIEQDEVYTG
jgi:hypothetical protein